VRVFVDIAVAWLIAAASILTLPAPIALPVIQAAAAIRRTLVR
jgi:hypothetical protein